MEYTVRFKSRALESRVKKLLKTLMDYDSHWILNIFFLIKQKPYDTPGQGSLLRNCK